MRDHQRKRLYTWERCLSWGRVFAEDDELRNYVVAVCYFCGIPTPGITFQKKRKNSAFVPPRLLEILSDERKHCGEMVLLHELAHYWVFLRYGDTHVADHGPEFTRCYCWLLSRFHSYKYDWWWLRASAERYGLDVLADDVAGEWVTQGEDAHNAGNIMFSGDVCYVLLMFQKEAESIVSLFEERRRKVFDFLQKRPKATAIQVSDVLGISVDDARYFMRTGAVGFDGGKASPDSGSTPDASK